MSDSEFIIPGTDAKKMNVLKDKLKDIPGIHNIKLISSASKLIITHDLTTIRPRRII